MTSLSKDLEIEAGKKTLKIAESATGSKNRIRSLMHFLDAKLLKPDLVTKQEEQVRAQLTWQALDHMLWKAVFGPVSGLQGLVCDPEAFRNSVENLTLIFSDQIPLWIKMGSEREVYAKWESAPVPQSELRELLEKHHLASLASAERGQSSEPLCLQVSDQNSGESGQRQKRSLKEDSLDRYRVTYEARQAVLNLLCQA